MFARGFIILGHLALSVRAEVHLLNIPLVLYLSPNSESESKSCLHILLCQSALKTELKWLFLVVMIVNLPNSFFSNKIIQSLYCSVVFGIVKYNGNNFYYYYYSSMSGEWSATRHKFSATVYRLPSPTSNSNNTSYYWLRAKSLWCKVLLACSTLLCLRLFGF